MAAVAATATPPSRADDLEDRLAVVVGQLNALHAQLVDLVAEARDTNAWAGAGIRTLTHWLTWKAGVTNERANALVRLADAQPHPPRAHPTVRRRPAHRRPGRRRRQGTRLRRRPRRRDGAARHRQPDPHHRALRPAGRPAAARPDRPAAAEPTDAVSFWSGDDGRYHLRADLAADHGRIVEAALDRRPRPHPPRQRHPPDVARRPRSTSPSARSTPSRRPGASTPASTCSSTRRPRCRPRGPTAPPSPTLIRRHLTCDALLSPVFTGRRPPGQRRTHAAHRPRPHPPPRACTATTAAAGSRGAAPAATSTSTTSSTGRTTATPTTTPRDALQPLPPRAPPRRSSASRGDPLDPTAWSSPTTAGASSPASPGRSRRAGPRRSPATRTSTPSANGSTPAASAPPSPTRRSTPHRRADVA